MQTISYVTYVSTNARMVGQMNMVSNGFFSQENHRTTQDFLRKNIGKEGWEIPPCLPLVTDPTSVS